MEKSGATRVSVIEPNEQWRSHLSALLREPSGHWCVGTHATPEPALRAFAIEKPEMMILGFEKGLSRSFREAPIFLGIFTALILVGATVAVIPGIPPIALLLVAQCVNGILLPILLIAILKLANNREIMGEFVNTKIFNILAYATTIIVSILSVLLIGKTIADMF